jgi:TRAP transporter TAXI family solute receptor
MRSARLMIVLLTLILFTSAAPPLARPQDANPLPTGFAVKRPIFGGSGANAGWGSIGLIAKEAIQFYGWDIQICSSCAGAARAARLVASAAMVPAAGPNDPPQPRGRIDFGATGLQYLWWAYQGTHDFANDPEGPRKNLRLIANIQSPSYVVIAVKRNSEITDLTQIREKRLPVRILTFMRDGNLPNSILAHYGLSREMIEAFGGSMAISNPEERKTFDVIMGLGAMDHTPEYEAWVDLSTKWDLRYLELPAELRSKLVKENDWQERSIPFSLFRGIDRPIPSVARTGTVLYGRDDMPDDFAYTLAKAMDEHQELLQWSNVTYSYNPNSVWKAFGVPLHPGAERYYRERGYMK